MCDLLQLKKTKQRPQQKAGKTSAMGIENADTDYNFKH